jgi:diguanylate cyclase (GGDEF)-like protein
MFPALVRLSINPSERPGRIAVVAADVGRRERLARLLEPEGYQVVTLVSPDAIAGLRAEFRPELILCDAGFDPNALELIRKLRIGSGAEQPLVILLGSEADEHAVATALYAGADDYVTDIARSAELRARIRVQLKNRRTLETLQRVRSERDILRKDSQIDPLTGLLNRRSLENSVRERYQSASRFGVLFMDIDHFKSVNDRFGHATGDRVLSAIGAVLRSTLRPEDAVGRYGGEEFVALIADAGSESARLVAERLRAQVEALPAVHGGPQVTLSVGSTVYDPQKHPESTVELFRRADAALYAAKSAGRNRVAALEPGASFPNLDQAAPVLASLPPESRPLVAPGFGEKA